jgi:lipopolysaccharide/colanic/teichoic acid biosynthesis glycosyltransferase
VTLALSLLRRPRPADPAWPRHAVGAPRLRRVPAGAGVVPDDEGALGTRCGDGDRPRVAARVLDVVVGGAALIVLSPVMAVVGAVVACTSRGPALFRQVRLGRNGRPFVMYKFRTMRVGSDDQPHREYVARLLAEPAMADGLGGVYKLADDPRITRVGRWLRETSLDELPQLFNVLKGDMSLVGPRPVLPWEAVLFGPAYDRRFEVRPGITGLWQCSGRNKLTMTQALDLDLRYVEEQSLRLDVAILLRTLPVVVGRVGVR